MTENELASVVEASPDQINSARSDEMIHCVWSQGTLVAIHDPHEKRSLLILIQDLETGLGLLTDAAKKFDPQLLRDLQVKLLGQEPVLSKAKEHLKRMGIPVALARVEQSDSNECFLSGGSGKIRLRRNSQTSIPTQKVKVLIVDDSKTIRSLLTQILSSDPAIEVVGSAESPLAVEELVEKLQPDVITLDIHMPEMNGVELLKRLLVRFQSRAVMISALSMEDGTFVLDALEAGAVDYIQKPSLNEIEQVAPTICEKIKNAAQATVRVAANDVMPHPRRIMGGSSVDLDYLIAIGSSTGGTEALKQVLTGLPESIPPILIVQHIPAVFSKAFADRMNHLCPFEVKEAQDGDLVAPSRVLIAPGGKQMGVRRMGKDIRIVINDAEPMNRHKPSVDVLFLSIAKLRHPKIAAGILTGMGTDGAHGLLALYQDGAKTLAQDEASSVVYGMPREAFRVGAAQKVVPLGEVADTLMGFCTQERKREAAL